MKATSGMLSLAQTYHLKTIHYGASSCENCGNYIKNVAEVVGSEDGRSYFIGVDCASTLTGIEPNRVEQAKKIFRRKAQARKQISKGVYPKVLIRDGVARFYGNYDSLYHTIQGNLDEFAESILDGIESREGKGYEPIAVIEVLEW
jgi:hypothetical protein